MENLLSLIIDYLFVVTLALFFVKDKNNLTVSNGEFVLEYSLKTISFFIFLFSITPLAFLSVIYSDLGAKTFMHLFLYLFLSLMFVFTGGYFFLSYKKEKVIMNKYSITRRYVFKSEKKLLWNEVVDVTYSKGNKCLVFHSSTGEKIRAGIFLKGFSSFCIETKNLVRNQRALVALEYASKDKIFTY